MTGNIRTLGKRFNSRRADHRNSAAYHSHRFPGVTAAELNARIARFGEQLGRFGDVRAEERSPYVFRIHDPEAAKRYAESQIPPAAHAAPNINYEGVGN